MPKMTLDRTYLYAGETYGPGEAEVPEDVAKPLAARVKAVAEAEGAYVPEVAGEQHPSDESKPRK